MCLARELGPKMDGQFPARVPPSLKRGWSPQLPILFCHSSLQNTVIVQDVLDTRSTGLSFTKLVRCGR